MIKRLLVCFTIILFVASWLYAEDTLDKSPLDGPGERVTVKSIEYDMVWIPPGTFQMGSPSSEPGRNDDEQQHTVTLTNGFYMGVTEVTLGQWRAFVKETRYKTEAEKDRWAYVFDGKTWVLKKGTSWKKPGFAQKEDHPVTCISWNDAQEFVKWVNKKEGVDIYRLPTEAEWEYASRAGSTTAYSFGNDAGSLGEYAWYDKNSGGKTHPVAQKQPNAWGLHDIHGNVFEWCSDLYGDYQEGSVTDPIGASTGSKRLKRGGGWYYEANFCRSAARSGYNPSSRYSSLGFRLARTQ